MPDSSNAPAFDSTNNPAATPDVVEPRYDTAKVSGASFDTVRRGFNEAQVRKFLADVASALRTAYATEDALRATVNELQAAPPEVEAASITEDLLIERLGDEASSILNAARAGAEARTAEAEAVAAKLEQETAEVYEKELAKASAEADRLRAEAQDVLDLKTAEANNEAKRIVAAVQGEVLQQRAEGERIVAEAKQEGRVILLEAKRHREQILGGLEKRRLRLREEIERLQAGRDRILESYDVVQGSIDTARRDLEEAAVDSKRVGEAAARKLNQEAERSIESLEDELAMARQAGMLGDADEIAAEAAAAGGVELADLEPVEFVPAEIPSVDAIVTDAAPEPEATEEVEIEVEAEVVAAVEVEDEEIVVEPAEDQVLEPDAPALKLVEPVVAEEEPVAEASETASLFAKLREETSAEAEAPKAEEAQQAKETEAAESDESAPAEETDDSQLGPLATDRQTAFEQIARPLAKQIKRELSDIQNSILHAHRTEGDVDEILSPDAMVELIPEVAGQAFGAGAEAIGRTTRRKAPEKKMTALFETSFLSPLLVNLGVAYKSDSAVESIRAICREARKDIDEIASAIVATSFASGAKAAMPKDVPVHWIRGSVDSDCAHLATNLGIHVKLGDEFPSGDSEPGTYPDCDCLVGPIHL